MVARAKVFEAADAIAAEGGRVSISSVRERLKVIATGGSPRDVLPYYREWRDERLYGSTAERSGLPPAVSGKFKTSVVALWAAAQEEAARIHEHERKRMEQRLRDEQIQSDEFAALAERFEEEAKLSRRIADDMRSQNAELASRLADVEDVGGVREKAFWDRVMKRAYDVLPREGGLRLSEIEAALGEDILEEAKLWRRNWDTENLRSKIDTRIKAETMFVRTARGLYRRRDKSEEKVGLGVRSRSKAT